MDATTPETHPHGTLDVTRPTSDTVCVRLSGQWTIQAALPSTAEVQAQCEASPHVQHLSFAASDLADWDSALLTFLLKLQELCDQRQMCIRDRHIAWTRQRLRRTPTARST